MTISRREYLQLVGSLGVGAAAGFRSTASAAQSGTGTIVEVASGRIRGTLSNGVHAFKGVPYGATTAGRNRWRPPVAAEPWSGVRDATSYGPRATQPIRVMISELSDALTGSGPMSEDCLRLNVWSAGLTAADRRPVMVFLHGGGYQTGSGNSILYDGSELARRHGVVIVTLTHRLNAFGYLYLDEIGGPDFRGSANAGLLDLVAALEWVRDNISRFGGDPGCVTVFGESGGAAKVCMLMAMPGARGLFHRAIVQSTLVDMAIRGLTPAQGTERAEILLGRLGLTAAQAGRMRELPAEQIIEAMTAAPAGRRLPRDNGQYIATSYYPVVDGRVVPAHPFHPSAPLVSADVPLLCGSTENEVTPYLDAAQLEPLDAAGLHQRVKAVLRVDDAMADRVITLYRSHRSDLSNLAVATMIASDNSVMRGSEYVMAERKTALGKAPVFLYYFQWPSPVRDGRLGAMHGIELPFVFHNTDKVPALVGTGPDLAPLADTISTAWTTFARTGNPSSPGHAWPAFNPQTRPTMVFDRVSGVVNDPYGEERRLLESIRTAQASLPPHAPPGCASVVCEPMSLR